MSLLVLTGPPGAGKTTAAVRLAAASPSGVHVPADMFHTFLSCPIPPVRTEAHAQNAVMIRAMARAADAYARGGYEVVLEGIVGPWSLPLLADELRASGVPVDYAVLRVGLDVAIRRAGGRLETPAAEVVVRQMHAAFADLGVHERHVVPVGTDGPDRVAERPCRLREAGVLRLDLDRLAAS